MRPPRRLPALFKPVGGFTLVELIAVMVVMAVLAAVGVGRFFDRVTYDADEFVQQSRAMLRYAQKLAIAQNRAVYVRLDGTTVALCFDSGCASRVLAPAGANTASSATLAACNNDGKWSCEAKPATVSYAMAPSAPYAGANNFFYFDALGKPFAATDSPLSSTFAPLTINVTANGQASAIVVEQETGYVH